MQGVHNAQMEFIFGFVGQILRSVLRLVLFLAAGVFMLSLLAAILGAVLLTAMWSLLTGRKPAVFTTFSRFRQATRQFRQGTRPQQGGVASRGATHADVVDVQAHEVGEPAGYATVPPEQLPRP
jgi:hypothetical protein